MRSLRSTRSESGGSRHAISVVLATALTAVMVSAVGGSPAGAATTATWTQAAPATSPPARREHAMAFDSGRNRLVLFGGVNSIGLLSDTWEWDGATWTLRTPATSPPPRLGHTMAYDSTRHTIVLFGGVDGAGRRNDTWEWDGTAWTQRTPATSPPARSHAGMAYDGDRQQLVLFGGWGTSTNLGDTWQWNGTTWTQASPAASPPARREHAMAYDSAHQTVVLFGGHGTVRLGDTWQWNGTTWTQASPAASAPARWVHAMAYDNADQTVVLFGGETNAGRAADTWEWDGTTWTHPVPPASPGALIYHAMAYDSAREMMVLFGGLSPTNTHLADTWTFGVDPTVDITTTAVRVTEGDAGTTSATFTVGLSHLAAADVTVGFHTVDGTATSPADYSATTGSVTIPAGALSADQTIPILGDVSIEDDHGFSVVLDGVTAGAATLGSTTDAPVTIVDDDTTTVTVTSVTVDEGAGTADVRVELTKPFADVALTVDLATVGSTATSPTDFTAGAASVVVPAGATQSPSWPIPIADDELWEATESLTVEINGLSEARPGLVTGVVDGTVTITDDDPTPVVTIGSLTMLEGDAGATMVAFPVSLRHPAASAVTLGWATANGTATAGSDYTATSGTVVFAPGQTDKSVQVAIRGDTVVEPNETFTVALSDIPAGFDVAQGTANSVILNDDGARSLSVLDAEVNESAGTVTVTVALSDPLAGPLEVSFATSAATAAAGTDYDSTTGMVTIAAGVTTQTISVPIRPDLLVEPDETFRVTASIAPDLNVVVSRASGVVTILDDDAATISLTQVDSDPIAEGATGTSRSVRYEIVLSAPVSTAVQVAWATDETDPAEATSGADFAARSGSVTFQPGATSRFVTATVRGDALHEGDEQFVVAAWPTSAVRGVLDATTSITTTIADDDPVPTISIGSVSLTEGHTGTKLMWIPVTLSAASGAVVTAAVTTVDGTATAGSDYTAVTTVVTFQPGDRTEGLSVPVIGDTVEEANEKFTVSVSDVVGAHPSTLSATGTIIDDDTTVAGYRVSIRDLTLTEGHVGLRAGKVTVSLNQVNNSGGPLTVRWATADGSAVAALNDYVTASGLVTFAVGQQAKAVTVYVKGNRVKEPNETFTVQLKAPSTGLQLAAKNAAIITITNDD